MAEKKTLSSKRREEKRKKRRRALAAPFFTVLFALGVIALIITGNPEIPAPASVASRAKVMLLQVITR